MAGCLFLLAVGCDQDSPKAANQQESPQAAATDPYSGAYEAAKKYATQSYPTVKSFSSFSDTGVTFMDGKGYYQVELIANFANDTDRPEKKVIDCSVAPDGNGQWKLLKIYTDTWLSNQLSK
jgi:hypothetical protein